MGERVTDPRGTAPLPPWPLRERPGFLIRRLHQIHVALFGEACADFDVTPVQYSLLSALEARGEADQTTLAADVALDRTTATGALKRLQARGFVERATSASDRRARECRLTALGADMLGRIEASARAAHRRTIAALDEAEQQALVSLMTRIVDAEGERTRDLPIA